MTRYNWKTLRQITQVLAFILFLAPFFVTVLPTKTDLFFQLDPLIVITTGLAGRIIPRGLFLAGLTVLVTLVFGKVWCGWFCPLGSFLDWIPPHPKNKRQKSAQRQPHSHPNSWRMVKYFIFLLIVFAALFGNQTLIFLDPITILDRTIGSTIFPGLRYTVNNIEGFLYQFPFLWNFLDIIHNNVTHPIFQDVKAVFIQSLPLLLIFITLVILNQWTKRFWCRYLCPLGGLLGLLSKFALIRRQVGNECSECALCLPACPVDTINPENGFNSDPAECTVCYDCIVACKKKDNAFQWQLTNWKVAEKQEYDIGRRQAIKAFGVAALGVTLAGIETITIREPSIFIRPPGARSTSFDSLCIRCGECVRVCPTQGLQPTLFEAGWQNIFTPQLVPRLGACSFSCNQCGIVCPSGAIPALSLEEKQKTSIGLARVDKNRCLPWAYNTACIVCEESCPLPEKAITLEKIEYQDQDGQPQSIQCPSVVKNRCIGCGICEYQCPMGGESAIRVYTYTEASNIQVQ